MNFLAHLYLSGTSDEIKIGNFIGDFVKGDKFKNFGPVIQEGIQLHREIDSFTDSHAVNKMAKRDLSEHFRHYSGVVLDLYWDHFLARHWDEFHDVGLKNYTTQSFRILNSHWNTLPAGVQRMLPYMERDNWLFSYRTIEGITQALNGLSRRTKYESNMAQGGRVLQENYQKLEQQFYEFIPDLQDHVSTLNPHFQPI